MIQNRLKIHNPSGEDERQKYRGKILNIEAIIDSTNRAVRIRTGGGSRGRRLFAASELLGDAVRCVSSGESFGLFIGFLFYLLIAERAEDWS